MLRRLEENVSVARIREQTVSLFGRKQPDDCSEAGWEMAAFISSWL